MLNLLFSQYLEQIFLFLLLFTFRWWQY